MLAAAPHASYLVLVIPILLSGAGLGISLLLIGLGIVFAPLLAYFKAQKTAYAVTDKRVLVITGGRTRSIKSCTPADIVSVDHREREGGHHCHLLAIVPPSRKDQRNRISFG